MRLPEKLNKAIEQNGLYITQINLKQQILNIHFILKKEKTYDTP